MAPLSGDYSTGLGWQPPGLATYVESSSQVRGSRGRHLARCAGVPGKFATIGFMISQWNTQRALVLLSPQNRPCLCPVIIGWQRVKHVLFTRLTHIHRNQMAWTFGLTSGLAWPSLTAACPKRERQRVWTRCVQPEHSLSWGGSCCFEQHGCPGPCAIIFSIIFSDAEYKD